MKSVDEYHREICEAITREALADLMERYKAHVAKHGMRPSEYLKAHGFGDLFQSRPVFVYPGWEIR